MILEAATAAGLNGAAARRSVAASVFVVVEQAMQQSALGSAAVGSRFAAARRSDFETASRFDGAATGRCIAAAVVVVVAEQAVQQTTLGSAAAGSNFATASRGDFTTARRSDFAATGGLADRSGIATRIMVAKRAIEQAERAGVDRAACNKGNGQQDGGDYTTHREHLH